MTKIESKLVCVLQDFKDKIFNSTKKNSRDAILSGNEKIDFSREEQIAFTQNEYIGYIIKDMNPRDIRLIKILTKYDQINMIKLQELETVTFS